MTTAHLAMAIAVLSVLMAIGASVLGVKSRRRLEKLCAQQMESLAVYTVILGEVRKTTQEALLHIDGEVSEYERGRRSFAYEVVWELNALKKARDSSI